MRAPCVSATVLFITATQDLACHYGSHQPRMAIDIQFLVTLPVSNALYLHEANVYLMEQERKRSPQVLGLGLSYFHG